MWDAFEVMMGQPEGHGQLREAHDGGEADGLSHGAADGALGLSHASSAPSICGRCLTRATCHCDLPAHNALVHGSQIRLRQYGLVLTLSGLQFHRADFQTKPPVGKCWFSSSQRALNKINTFKTRTATQGCESQSSI